MLDDGILRSTVSGCLIWSDNLAETTSLSEPDIEKGKIRESLSRQKFLSLSLLLAPSVTTGKNDHSVGYLKIVVILVSVHISFGL